MHSLYKHLFAIARGRIRHGDDSPDTGTVLVHKKPWHSPADIAGQLIVESSA